MKKLILWVAIPVIVLAGGIVAAPNLIDWNAYKPDLAKMVRDATGRELAIGSDLDVSVFPGVKLTVANVSIGGPPDGNGAPFARLGRLSVELELLPLLFGDIVVHDLEVVAPELHLAIDRDGRPNWTFPAAADGTAASEEEPGAAPSITVDGFRISGATITFVDAGSGRRMVADQIDLDIAAIAPGRSIAVDGRVRLNGRVVAVSLVGGALSNLLEGGAFAVDAKIEADRIAVAFNGSLDQVSSAVAGDLEVRTADLPDLLAWLDPTGTPSALGIEAVALSGRLSAGPGRVALSEAVLVVDQTRATGRVEFDGAGKVPVIRARIDAGRIDLDRYVAAVPAKPADDSGTANAIETPVDLTALQLVGLDVQLNVAGIGFRDLKIGRSGLSVRLADGVLQAELSELDLYGGRVIGRLRLDSVSSERPIETELGLSDISIGPLVRDATGIDGFSGVAGGDITLAAKGSSPREMLASLDGGGRLSLTNAALELSAFGAVTNANFQATFTDFDQPMILAGGLMFRGERVALAVETNSMNRMLADRTIIAKAELESAKAAAGADLRASTDAPAQVEGKVTFSSPNLRAFLAWLGISAELPEDGLGPVNVSGHLALADRRVELRDVSISIDDVTASGDISVDTSQDVPAIRAALKTGRLDLDRYMPAGGTEPAADDGAAADGGLDAPLDLSPLRQLNADVSLDVAGLKVSGIEVGRCRVAARLDGGVLAVDLTEMALFDGRINGRLAIDASGDRAVIEARIGIDAVDLAAAVGAVAGIDQLSGAIAGSLELRTEGATIEQLIAAADGRGAITLRDGAVALQGVEPISGLEATLMLDGRTAPVRIEAGLTYRDQEVALAIETDPLDRLAEGGPIGTRVDVRSAPLRISFDGAADPAVGAVEGALEVTTPSVRDILAWLDVPADLPGSGFGPFALSGQLAAAPGRAGLTDLALRFDQITAEGSVEVDTSGAVPYLSVRLETGEIALDPYLPEAGAETAATSPAADAGAPAPLDPSPLRMANADLAIAVAGLGYRDIRVGRIALRAELRDGVLTTNLDQLALFDGQVGGRLQVDGSTDELALDIDLRADDIDTAAAAALADLQGVSGRARAAISLRGRGRTVAELLDSLGGGGEVGLRDGAYDVPGAGPLSEIQLTVAVEAFDRPVAAEGSAVFNGERITLKTRIDPPRKILAGEAVAVETTLKSKHFEAGYSGTVRLGPKPALDGAMLFNTVNLLKMAAWAGGTEARAGPRGALRAEARIKLDDRAASLAGVRLSGDGIAATGEARVEFAGPVPRLSARLDAKRLDLNPYLPPEQAASATPANQGGDWSDAPIDLEALRSIDAEISLSAREIRVRDLRVGQSDLAVRLRGGRLRAEVKRAALYGGRATATINIDASSRVPAVDMTAELRGARAAPLLRDTADFDRLEGTVSGRISAKTRGASERHMVANMNGAGDMRFLDGAIRGFNMAAMVRSFSTVSLTGAFSDQQKTDFAELSGSFRIERGVLRNTDLAMMAPLLRVTGQGTVDLPDRTVDYRTEVKAVASLQGQGARSGLSGLAVPVLFTGPWDDLSIRPDMAGLFLPGAAGAGTVLDGAKTLIEGGAGGIAGGFKGLLKSLGAQQPAPAKKQEKPRSGSSTPSFRPTDTLKRLFK